MKNGSVFYGWWVVAGFSLMTFISTGIRHAVGPFLKPIVADLGLDRASFSLVIAMSLFLYGVFGPLVGLALDRFGARLTASVGTILLVGSLVLTAQVRNFWEFAIVYGVILPLGLAVTGPVMASGVVRTPSRPGRDLRGEGADLLGILPEPRQPGRDPDRGRPGRDHDGGDGLDDLRAHRRHLGPLLGEPGARRNLPRAPDRCRHRLVAGRRAP